MANLGDDTEKFIDESMPLFFEKLGDSTALTEHGCLTVAQCALLIPATLTQNKTGDASEIAAHYVQLALLDIAEGELSPKHPQTLLPYSQYLRMMESGMHGVDGEALPMPTADWLVTLTEAQRWLKAKGFDINFDGLLEGLNAATSSTKSATNPKSGPLPVSTGDMAFCFKGLRWKTEAEWKKPLGDKPKWLAACVAIQGVRGVSETRWNPVCIGAALVRAGHAKPNSVRAKFQSEPLLFAWREEWLTYEADYLDTE